MKGIPTRTPQFNQIKTNKKLKNKKTSSFFSSSLLSVSSFLRYYAVNKYQVGKNILIEMAETFKKAGAPKKKSQQAQAQVSEQPKPQSSATEPRKEDPFQEMNADEVELTVL